MNAQYEAKILELTQGQQKEEKAAPVVAPKEAKPVECLEDHCKKNDEHVHSKIIE
jgi:hypothetical protein